MEYNVNIPEFEGPLDLLLHLIKKNDIDIFDISIDTITKQYLDYINRMEELNLNIASEYLVMASYLLELKSRTLLPTNDEEQDESKEELINSLLEYQCYKETTDVLKKYESLRKEVYTTEPIYEEFKNDNIALDLGVSIDDLAVALLKFLENKETQKPLITKVTNKEYSTSRRCVEIRDILRNKKRVNFLELFDIVTKEYIVVTFLAILNMSKRNEINIKQDNNFNNIIVEAKGCEENESIN